MLFWTWKVSFTLVWNKGGVSVGFQSSGGIFYRGVKLIFL